MAAAAAAATTDGPGQAFVRQDSVRPAKIFIIAYSGINPSEFRSYQIDKSHGTDFPAYSDTGYSDSFDRSQMAFHMSQ